MEQRIVELRNAGYTWNQIDEKLLPVEKIIRKNGKIISQCYKIAAKAGLPAFSKKVIGAYTATQIVIPIRKFCPSATPIVSMVTDGGF